MTLTAFATLLEQLAFTPQRNRKEQLLAATYSNQPDPERGLMLAALTGDLRIPQVTSSLLRSLVSDRVDPQLFATSYDFVGDLAETIALIWPKGGEETLLLSTVLAELAETPKHQLPEMIASRLDMIGPSERYAYLKLATGALRVGVSARLARGSFAHWAGISLQEIEECWHALTPPYAELFAWAAGGSRPMVTSHAPFRPVMLSTPFEPEVFSTLNPIDYAAEWKWDGIRVQAVSHNGHKRLYSRTGEDISAAFPDVIALMNFEGALDGELLVRQGSKIGSFADLQKRLNRKTVGPALLRSHPAGLRVYDVLTWEGRDLRALSYDARRTILQQLPQSQQIDLSAALTFNTWADLAAQRQNPPDTVIEGVMIKRRDSAYLGGRVKGHWFKWKRDPFLIDAVLMYAQRGHGKRSGYYSDFTFGVWHGANLVPVGKAYFGFTDAELKELDRFVRNHTLERFGPMRSVERTQVVEVAFDGLSRSMRHKSGVAMRFPRINRIRRDKPASEADHIETLQAMLSTTEPDPSCD